MAIDTPQTILAGVWLLGWAGATIFAASVIGNVPNRPGDPPNFPTFLVPLLFGWIWPVLLGMCLIIAPLTWLSDRATKRATLTQPPSTVSEND